MKHYLLIKKISFLLIAVFLTIKSSFAVQQGDLDENESIGELEMAIEVTELVKLSGLDDLYFSKWDNQSQMAQSDDICIYSNSAMGAYSVTARGSGAGGAFVVDDGVNKVNYQVYWQDQIESTSMGSKLEPNINAYNQLNGNNKYFDCNGINNARLTIVFLKEELRKSIGSHYSGNLVIQISPI